MNNNICNYCKNIILSGNNIYYAYDNKYCSNRCRTCYIKNNIWFNDITDNIYIDQNIKLSTSKSFNSLPNVNNSRNENTNNKYHQDIYNNINENTCKYTINYTIKFLLYITSTLYNI